MESQRLIVNERNIKLERIAFDTSNYRGVYEPSHYNYTETRVREVSLRRQFACISSLSAPFFICFYPTRHAPPLNDPRITTE